MSDTPRTDGIEFLSQPGMMPPYNTVPSSFSRELERENAKLREALVAINNWTGNCVDDPCAIGSPNPKEIAGDALEP